MTDYKKYINALRKSAKEHENDRTSFGHIIVSDLCRDTANLLESLEQELREDCISREQAFKCFTWTNTKDDVYYGIKALPSIQPKPKPKTGHCKDCKFFEYDSVAKVDGIPLIVAHEICKKWGDGCKTNEDGYCFLFEPQESEKKNESDN